MDTNKYTATRKSQAGNSIEVTIERGTWDDKIYSDGWDTGIVKTHLVNSTQITLRDKSGKQLAHGEAVKMVTPTFFFKNYKELINKGAIAMVGDAFIGQSTLDLINEAMAEADLAVPKTSRQIEIETAESERKAAAEAWQNSAEGKAAAKKAAEYAEFVRKMEDPNSDY